MELQTISSFANCLCSSLVLFLGIDLGMFATEMLPDLKLDRKKITFFFCALFFPALKFMFVYMPLDAVG